MMQLMIGQSEIPMTFRLNHYFMFEKTLEFFIASNDLYIQIFHEQ